MASRKPNASSSSVPPPIDYIDLTTESPIRRSLQTRTFSTARTEHNPCRQEEAMLISTILDVLDATVTMTTDELRNRHRSGTRSQSRSRSRSVGRIRTRIRAPTRSRINSNNDCGNDIQADKTITIDDTGEPEHNSRPWCIDDSTTDTPFTIKCAICLEELESERKPMATRCGHVFCAECLEKVICEQKKCPICQKKITQKTCVRLYF